MMLPLSPSRARARAPIVAAALAVGCLLSILSLSVHDSTTPATLLDPSEYSPRQLRVGRARARTPSTLLDPSEYSPRRLRERPWRERRDRLRLTHNQRFHSPAAGAPWWEDVLYGRDWACGRFKCFFRSASDPSRGYLVADRRGQGSHTLKTYEYATHLEEEFGIRHFHLGPPYLLATPGYFVEHLADTPREKLGGATTLVIQDMIRAPQGSKVSKCRYFEKDVFDYFIEHGEKGWQRTLMEEMRVTKSLLDFHKELAHDWQIMIDLQGHVYHLDFDRTYRIIGKTRKARGVQDCLDEAIAYIEKSISPTSESR